MGINYSPRPHRLWLPSLAAANFWEFDPALATITPRMSMRDGPSGVWATGFPIQGSFAGLTSDILRYPPGTQIFGHLYDIFDPYQGTFETLWTPEKDRDATQTNDEYLFFVSSFYFLRYEHDTQRFVYAIGAQTDTVAHTSVAGAVTAVVLRWDVTNDLDGANYACLSLDTVHDYGIAVQPTASAPGVGGWINHGSLSGANPANAIMEGSHFHRRVWTADDATGIDVGNTPGSDEITEHYDGGTFRDPSEVVNGPWDGMLGMPGTGTPGPLASGNDCFWSMPHRTGNLLGHRYGLMNDGFGPNQGYCVAFNGTTTSVVVSDGIVIQDLADNMFTPEIWVRKDGDDAADMVFAKGATIGQGWRVMVSAVGDIIRATIFTDGTDATSETALGSFLSDGKWHHIAVFYNDAAGVGARFIYIAKDGFWEAAYEEQQSATGAILTDVGEDLYMGEYGDSSLFWDGKFGWARISDNDRYDAATPTNFTPARTPPGVDGNTLVQWNYDEGTGVTLDNEVGAAAYDGTIANGSWENKWAFEGAVDALVELSDAERSYANQGFKITTSGANIGIYKAFIVTPGDNFVQRFQAYSDGVSVIQGIMYDQDNAAIIGSLLGVNTSDREAPDVFLFACQAPVGCTEIRVKFVETNGGGGLDMHVIQAEVYDNLIGNPSMDSQPGWLGVSRTLARCTETNALTDSYSENGIDWTINELTMVPGFEVQVTITIPAGCLGTTLYMYGHYDGNPAHTVNVDVYNYDTPAWDNLGTVPDAAGDALHSWALTVPADQISGTDVLIRFDHVSNGAAGHFLYIDHLYLGVDPWIPYEWNNDGLDPGDSVSSAGSGAIIHSGTDCIELKTTAATNERLRQDLATAAAVGDFWAFGGFFYGDGSGGYFNTDLNAGSDAVLQSTTAGIRLGSVDTAAWQHVGAVWRAIDTSVRVLVRAWGTATGLRYADDAYVFELDKVAHTATPANAANCVESGGLRVVGATILTQPILATEFFPTHGEAHWIWRPRHDSDVHDSFGSSSVRTVYFYRDANNYISIYQADAAPNTIRVLVVVGGVVTNIPGVWVHVADVEYNMRLVYTPVNCRLYIDSVLTITATPGAGIDFGVNVPNLAYMGSNQAGLQQVDAVFI